MGAASPTVELVLSEFGLGRPERARLEPTLSGFRTVLPEARVTLYTDGAAGGEDAEGVEGVETRRVEPPFERDHAHYASRARDWSQARGLLRSEASVAVAMDGNMRIVSEEFRLLLPLVQRFGLAVAASPHLLVSTDAELGEDGGYDPDSDPSGGTGFAYGRSPLALDTRREEARALLGAYLRIMEAEPARGPLVLWRAAWETGFPPYLLPYSWCLGSPAVLTSKHLRGQEIALRSGEPGVEAHFRRTRRRLAVKRMFRGIFGGGRRP
jgi:hypothetical protein